MPEQFQRVLGAWEVCCAWARRPDSGVPSRGDRDKAGLKAALERFTPDESNEDWSAALHGLKNVCPVKIMEGIKEGREVEWSETTDGLTKLIYTVRCNLVHGSKDPSDRARDLPVTDAAARVLLIVVRRIVSLK